MTTITIPTIKDWKTTAAGILSAFIGTVGPVTAYLATTPNPNATKICGGLTLAAAIARIWLGLIQKDAGSQLALVPGSATPVDVPAHQTPDDPAAIPIHKP